MRNRVTRLLIDSIAQMHAYVFQLLSHIKDSYATVFFQMCAIQCSSLLDLAQIADTGSSTTPYRSTMPNAQVK